MNGYLEKLQAQGRYAFTDDEARRDLGLSQKALQAYIRRNKESGRLVSPRRGFYVIVTLEYHSVGSPPVSWFLDALCRYMGCDYYAGLLTAASLHGASHQQPQVFQVVTPVQKRKVRVGRHEIRFFTKSKFEGSGTEQVKTETGYMKLSTPETTALDLIRYMPECGGAGNVISVFSELAPRISGEDLAAQITDEPSPILQRLGFILEKNGSMRLAEFLRRELGRRSYRRVSLIPGGKPPGPRFDARWNIQFDSDLKVES